jgi:hypothetical protein
MANVVRAPVAFGSLLLVLWVMADLPALGHPTPAAQDPPLVEPTDAAQEEFLRTARVIRVRAAGTGVTDSRRATLSDGRTSHDAHVQSIDVHSGGITRIAGQLPELNFRDSYKFNIAAYRLDRAIGLHMVPASVERTIEGKPSAVTWWVDDVRMMELDRYRQRIDPPDTAAWNDQMFTGRVFTELIYNTDANLGNFLITGDWRLYLIDFTRAFRLHSRLRAPENLGLRLDRRVYEGLKALDRASLLQLMKGYLTDTEIRPLLARRDVIVAHYDKLVGVRGPAAVLYDEPGR